MTAEEIDKLTIGEVRAIAVQAGEALEKLRAVQMALGFPMQPAQSPQHPTIEPSPPSPHDVPLPIAQAAALEAWKADPERQRLLDLNRKPADEPGEEFAT